MHARNSRRPAVLGFALAVAFALAASIATAQEAKPKRKDTNPRLRPPEVTYKVKLEPATAKPGDTVTYSVTVKVDDSWHIYAFAAEQADQGPRSTQFDFFDPAGLKPTGKWEPDQKPIKEKEAVFPDLEFVEFHEGEVVWSQELQVPADAKPGKRTLQNQIYFQICNDQACKPPVYVTLPPVDLIIEGGGETTSARPDPPGEEPNVRASADREPTGSSWKGAAETRLSSILATMFVGMQAEAAGSATVETASAAASAASQAPATVQEAIQGGILSLILFSALGGVAALLMPCVWPMVPITVNFFVKQGQARKGGSTTVLAIVYCLAIIAVFTLLGLLCAAFLGATSLKNLGNNPWLNLFVALVFIVFGLSLLGLFEIRLPAFLLNASARHEARGGYVGVVFMALTLTITSFTCTFPVVGGLLVIASKGQFFHPIIGMLVFATVLALPFFLLALMPGQLSRLPRSGDWMNSVKLVGGLVEIGAALKFLNVAEIGFGATPKTAWIDAQVMLASWVVLSFISGIYLLGLFRTDHDHEAIKVGAGRILSGTFFLAFALYLSPALFGYPPKGQVFDRLIVGILPSDVEELDPFRGVNQQLLAIQDLGASGGGTALAEGEGTPAPRLQAQHATSSDPEQAIREEKVVNGVLWGLSLDVAKQQASAQGRPILVDFTGVNCANCRQMEQTVFPDPEVIRLLRQFEPVQLYMDMPPIETLSQDDRLAVAEENSLFQQDLLNLIAMPYYVVMSPEGEVLAHSGPTPGNPKPFIDFLKTGLDKFQSQAAKVASASK